MANNLYEFKYHDTFIKPLSEYDVIMMRQDPPFNMAYISATHILEKLSSSTLIVNNPFEVRNSPEKIFVTNFSHLMPKTLISRNINAIKEFRKQFKDIIIKPLYGNGGQGIFHILPEDENLNSILEMFFSQNKEPLMIQEYLKDVRDGDKRIILLNGEAVGAINRIPKSGESRSNMHVGGKPEKTELTERDKFICKEISQSLVKKGLYFVGIDIIGDYITEINVTSGANSSRSLTCVSYCGSMIINSTPFVLNPYSIALPTNPCPTINMFMLLSLAFLNHSKRIDDLVY